MTIVLADDHTLVRAGIRALLESIHGVRVVAETGDGREALDLILKHKPDVAVVDIRMPGLGGLELAARLAVRPSSTRVVILSMHGAGTHLAQAMRSGVSGYILKDAAAQELGRALEAVAQGKTYVSQAIAERVLTAYRRSDKPEDPLLRLSARQREVLQRIAEGRSTKEIASDLGLSVKTVETHRAQVMERLDIHDVAGLVRFAVRAGLISPGV